MSVTITDNAFQQVVLGAAEQVEGVRVRKRKGVEPQEGRVSLSLAVRYGLVLPDVARDVQARVVSALDAMCGVHVDVDVAVDEVDE